MRAFRIKAALAAAALSAGAAEASQPIAGAGNWMVNRRLPGVPQEVCTVRVEGPGANTSIILNDNRRPVLMVANPAWSGLAGEAEGTLSIDGGAAQPVRVHLINNLVVFMPPDEQMVQRLREARTLDWTVPPGRFRADVAGLGAALDALNDCRPGS